MLKLAGTRPFATAGLLCFLLYVPLIGYQIYTSGYNPDEWRFAVDLETDFANVHMRWATHIGHNILFGGQFLDFVHASLTFIPLFGISAILSMQTFSSEKPLYRMFAVVALFLAGGTHVYLTEILHYQTLALWFTLGLLASVLAQKIIEPCARTVPPAVSALKIIISTELIALSLGFYQSFVFLGFVVPAIAIIRVDKYTNRQIGAFLIRVLIVSGLALVLYRFQLKTVIAVLDLEPYFRFSGLPSSEVFVQKLMDLPQMLRWVYSGTLLGTPAPYKTVYQLTFLAILIAPLISSAVILTSRDVAKTLNIGRVLVGSYGALAILPTIVWFLYPEPWLVARSIGYVGFLAAAILLANTGLILSGQTEMRWHSIASHAGLAVAAILAVNSVVASSTLWPIFRTIHDRDVALANEIVSIAETLPEFDIHNTPIRTVGGLVYSDVAFGSFAGDSTFHPGVDMNSIFQVLYDAKQPAGSLPFSPRACPAFPSQGSLFLSDNMLFVCLEPSNGPLIFETCLPFNLGSGDAAFCWRNGLAALVASNCANIDLIDGDIHVVLDSSHASQPLVFTHQAEPSIINGLCLRLLARPLIPFQIATLMRRPRHGVAATAVTLTASRARPLSHTLKECVASYFEREGDQSCPAS